MDDQRACMHTIMRDKVCASIFRINKGLYRCSIVHNSRKVAYCGEILAVSSHECIVKVIDKVIEIIGRDVHLFTSSRYVCNVFGDNKKIMKNRGERIELGHLIRHVKDRGGDDMIYTLIPTSNTSVMHKVAVSVAHKYITNEREWEVVYF
jgi:dTDP-D-glucose 4,6-dehydratase